MQYGAWGVCVSMKIRGKCKDRRSIDCSSTVLSIISIDCLLRVVSVDSLLATGSGDFEALVDCSVAINSSLESVKDLVAFNELAEDSLVAVKVGSSTESDGEFRSSRVLAVVGDGKLATFIVSHGQILVLETNAIGADVLVAHTATRDSKSCLPLMEVGASVGVALGAVAECGE